MKKKLAALAGAGVLLLSMAGPALGWGGWWWGSDDDLVINNHDTTLNSTVRTNANTGHNGSWFGGLIMTGPAGATSMVTNDVNSSIVGCDCADDVTINNNHTRLNSTVTTSANTGYNHGGGWFGGGIDTGSAGATSMVSNFVNTVMVGF